MDLVQLLHTAKAPVLLVSDALCARQWESYLHDAMGVAAAAWPSPAIVPLRAFFDAAWNEHLGERGDRSLLTSDQSRALWERVVEDSPNGAALISTTSAVGWASQAWRLIGDWGIAVESLRATDTQPDFAAFLEWCRDYRGRLATEGWSDRGLVATELNACGAEVDTDVALLDLGERAPEVDRFLRRQTATVVESAPPPSAARIQVATARDPQDELAQAAAWVRGQLSIASTQRLALVVPDLAERREEVRARLEEAVEDIGEQSAPTVWLQRETALSDLAPFGAALGAIELLSPHGSFMSFSRWLRSPSFHDSAQAPRCALLETRLRKRLESQTPFLAAYRSGGFGHLLRLEIPAAAAGLDAALERIERLRRSASPTDWSATWQSCLRDLGWRKGDTRRTEEGLDAWEAAVRRFSARSAIVGDIGISRAIDSFGALVRETSVDARLPLRGVHVFEHARHVGPGYAGVWIMGFTDRLWPEPESLNPLLPRRLQVEHEMPRATPALARYRSRRMLERLLARIPSAVFSTASRLDDQIVEPSTMLEELGLGPIPVVEPGAPARHAARRVGSRAIESVTDAAPAFASARIPGGARTLDQQSACPVRAFCESRLDAREIEPLERGLPPRLLGVAMHDALEHLLAEAVGRDEPVHPLDYVDGVEDAVSRALAKHCRWSHPVGRALVALERRRMSSRIRDFLEAEASRLPFRIEALEQRIDVSIGGRLLRCRIDRLDRLDDGGLAILDYKTGQSADIRGWFQERLRDPQLPLYAQASDARPSMILIVSFADGSVRYKGQGDRLDAFGMRSQRLPEGRSWPQQILHWERQLADLVSEFAAGDTRLFAADVALAKGAYSPLTRVYEHIARQPRQ